MSRRRKKGQGYVRITATVSEEVADRIKQICEEDDVTLASLAGTWLEERDLMQNVLEDGGAVTIEDSNGNVRQLRANRRPKLMPFN